MADPRDETGSGDGKAAGGDQTTSHEVPRLVRMGNRALEIAETIVYVGIAAFLVVTAISLLVVAGRQLIPLFTDQAGGQVAITVLDTLLLVFIVVELLFAVRITIAKRELIAEPFLLVGIIASIKEIVVLSVKAAEKVGKGEEFSDSMWEIGVLGGLVFLLGLTSYLLRRKEREPGEGEQGEGGKPARGTEPVGAAEHARVD